MEDNIDFFHFKGELVDRDNFDSESKDLNKYVKEYIGQYESSSRARNYVGISNGNFVSFFSLSASTLKTNEKEKAAKTKKSEFAKVVMCAYLFLTPSLVIPAKVFDTESFDGELRTVEPLRPKGRNL